MKNTLEIQKKIKNSMDSSQNPTLNIQDVSIESTTESNSMPNYQDGNNLSAKPSLTESIDAITVLNSASSETITQRTTTVTTIHTDFDLTNNDKISSDSPILTSFQLLPDFTHFNDDEFLGFPYNTEPNVFKTKSLKVEYPQHENNLVTDNLKSDSDVLNRNLQNDSENNANNGMDEETKLNQTKNTNEIVHYRALDVQPSPNPNVELIDDSPTQSPKNHLYNTNPNQLINTNSTQKIDLFDSQKSSKFYGLETYSSDEDGEFDKRYSMKSDASSNLDSYGPHSRSSELENSAIPEVAATIPVYDDVSLPVGTFRVFFIATIISLISSMSAQFYFFRLNRISLDTISQVILAYPMGIALSKLPAWTRLNQSPFNHKEHTLIAIACLSSTKTAAFSSVFFIQRKLLKNFDANGTIIDAKGNGSFWDDGKVDANWGSNNSNSHNLNTTSLDSKPTSFKDSSIPLKGPFSNSTINGTLSNPFNNTTFKDTNTTEILLNDQSKDGSKTNITQSLNSHKFPWKNSTYSGYSGLRAEWIIDGYNIGIPVGVFLTAISQLIGLGLGGFLRKFLVYPAKMWWPENLIIANLIHTFHDVVTENITRLRMRMFKLVFLFAFLYQFLPQMAFPVLQSVSLLCLLAGGASGTLQGPGVFGNNVASDSRTFIGQLGSMDGGGILSLSLDWTAIAGLQPLVTPIWAQVNVLVACIGFAWVLTPLYVYFNVWGSQTFPAISVEGYHLNGTFYNLWRVMDFKTVTIPITKEIPDLYVSPSFAFVIGCRFAVMSAAVVHFLLYYAKSSWSIFRTSKSKLIQRDVHSRMMLQYPDVPAHWYFLCMGISTLAAMFVTHHYRTEFQSEWWNVPFALALSGCFSLPFGIIRAISNQSLNFNVLAQFIMGMLKPGYILANVTFRGFCSAIMDTALMYCVSMKLGQYMKIPPRLTFLYHLWGIIVSSFGNFTVLDMAMTMMAKHARNWAQSFSQSAWKANQYNHGAQWTAAKLPKMLMTSAQIWGGVSPKRFFTSETGYDNLYWFFVIGAIFPIMNYIMLRNFPRIGFHYINWPIIFQAVGLVPIGFANSILSVAIVTFITQHLVRKHNRRWYDRYNYILSGALDSAAIIVPVIVFFLNRGIPELSTSLNSPLNPNKTIFGPDYCGNVNRSSWIKQPRENRTRIP